MFPGMARYRFLVRRRMRVCCSSAGGQRLGRAWGRFLFEVYVFIIRVSATNGSMNKDKHCTLAIAGIRCRALPGPAPVSLVGDHLVLDTDGVYAELVGVNPFK